MTLYLSQIFHDKKQARQGAGTVTVLNFVIDAVYDKQKTSSSQTVWMRHNKKLLFFDLNFSVQ